MPQRIQRQRTKGWRTPLCSCGCDTAELSPAYVDTTVRRWQQHTGGTPQRNGVPHSLEP